MYSAQSLGLRWHLVEPGATPLCVHTSKEDRIAHLGHCNLQYLLQQTANVNITVTLKKKKWKKYDILVLSKLSNWVGKSSVLFLCLLQNSATQTLLILSRTQARSQTKLKGIYNRLPGLASLLPPFQNAFYQPKYTNMPLISTKTHMLKGKINSPGLSWIEALDTSVDVPTDLSCWLLLFRNY